MVEGLATSMGVEGIRTTLEKHGRDDVRPKRSLFMKNLAEGPERYKKKVSD